jgi:TPR repeat protein
MRRRLLRLFVIFIIAGAFATAAVSQTSDLASLRARAEAGDAKAQFEVGAKYYKGEGFATGL